MNWEVDMISVGIIGGEDVFEIEVFSKSSSRVSFGLSCSAFGGLDEFMFN